MSIDRITYELETAKLIVAALVQNPNYPIVEHAQDYAQKLADAFESRGYFLEGEAAKGQPLHRYEAAPTGDSPSATREVGAVGGHSRVQFVRGQTQAFNQRG